MDDDVIGAVATAHDKSLAQVMLRWHLQRGRSVIPKSTNAERIAQNIDVFDFALDVDDLAAIDAPNPGRARRTRSRRGGPLNAEPRNPRAVR